MIAASTALLAAGVAYAISVPPVPPGINAPQFELDGNLQSQTAGMLDWYTGSAGTGVIQHNSSVTSDSAIRNSDGTCSNSKPFALGGPGVNGNGVLVCDGSAGNFADQNGFTSGSHEESGANPQPWDVAVASSPKKADLAEVYVYGKLFDSPFKTVDDNLANNLMFAMDMTRLDTSGDTHADFEFNQLQAIPVGQTGCAVASVPSNTTVCQPRSDNDIIVSFDIARGGASPTTTFYRFYKNNSLPTGAVCADSPQASIATGGCYVEVAAPAAAGGEPGAFATLNGSEVPAPPWKTVGCSPTSDNNSPGCTLRTNIPTSGNMEGFVDLTAFFGPDFSLCPGFAQVTAKTRSSNGLNSSLQDTTVPIPITASQCGSLLIKKQDPSNNLLPGAGFTISPNPFTGVAGSSLVVNDGGTNDVATGNNGVICLDNVLFSGSPYTISETKVPAGYFGDPNSQTVSVSSASTCASRLNTDGTIASTATPDATFTNTLGSIIVEKFGPDGTTPLAGAGFTFTPNPFTGSSTGTEVVDGTTNDHSAAGGIVCIDGVKNLGATNGTLNSYSITETTVPTGYFGSTATQTVTVSSPSTCASRLNSDGTLKTAPPATAPDATFTNTLGSLIIEKFGPDGTTLLKGAGFTFTPNPFDGTTTPVEVVDGSGADHSTADGILCIDGVHNIGTSKYSVQETTVPSGYFGDSSTKQISVVNATCASRLNSDGTLKSGQTADTTFTNTLGSIVIKKFGPDGTTLLGGAGFTVTPNPFTGSSTGLEVLDASSNDHAAATGVVCIDGVRNLGSTNGVANTYSVTETHVPAGYFGDTSSNSVTVVSGTCASRGATSGSSATADTSFTNRLGTIVVEKVGKNKAAGGTVRLSGATFTVTPNPLTGTGSLDVTDNGTNDAFGSTNGLICIDGVLNPATASTPFTSYTVTEKTPPTGYSKDSSTPTVTVAAGTCAGRTTSTTADVSFTDTPLTTINFGATSQATGGTSTVITCTDSNGSTLTLTSGTSSGANPSGSVANLPPGDYSCSFAVDP